MCSPNDIRVSLKMSSAYSCLDFLAAIGRTPRQGVTQPRGEGAGRLAECGGFGRSGVSYGAGEVGSSGAGAVVRAGCNEDAAGVSRITLGVRDGATATQAIMP